LNLWYSRWFPRRGMYFYITALDLTMDSGNKSLIGV
jgi:hypothetical protein